MPIDTPEWVGDAVFYQILPDRFARSTAHASRFAFEDWGSPPTVYGFKGGDLYGVAEQLDYLADLGISAIYLNPVFASAASHRYHTYDYFQVDPLLGGNAALSRLLEEAHQRGIRVVLDGVFNHCGRGFWQFHHVLENGIASPYADWFHFDPERLHRQREFLPYPDRQASEALQRGVGSLEAVGYAAWWNLPALPKFNIRNSEVREFLLSVAEHWMRIGIDGWRLDVPNEIDDDDFWREFRRRVRAINPEAYIVGEVWGDAQRWLQGDMWDGVMNYQVTAACLGFFGGHRLDIEEARRPSGFGQLRPMSAAEFVVELDRLERAVPAPTRQSQLNLLDSHDTPRFLTCVRHDTAALRMAWLLLCTLPGPPCVYYGDEIGMTGRQDPDCRRAFPRDRTAWDDSLLGWYRDCIRLRRSHPALRRGARRTLLADADVCIALHQLGSDRLIVAFNVGEVTRILNVDDPDSDGSARNTATPISVWKEWPDGRSVPRNSEKNTLTIAVPARSALVLTAT